MYGSPSGSGFYSHWAPRRPVPRPAFQQKQRVRPIDGTAGLLFYGLEPPRSRGRGRDPGGRDVMGKVSKNLQPLKNHHSAPSSYKFFTNRTGTYKYIKKYISKDIEKLTSAEVLFTLRDSLGIPHTFLSF